MRTAILGSVDQQGFLPGWTAEKVLAIVGSIKLDLTKRSPGDRAHLTTTAIIGSILVIASPGTRIALDGTSVLGSRRQPIAAGHGPRASHHREHGDRQRRGARAKARLSIVGPCADPRSPFRSPRFGGTSGG